MYLQLQNCKSTLPHKKRLSKHTTGFIGNIQMATEMIISLAIWCTSKEIGPKAEFLL